MTDKRIEVERLSIVYDDGRRMNVWDARHRAAFKAAKTAHPDSSISWYVEQPDPKKWEGFIVIIRSPRADD